MQKNKLQQYFPIIRGKKEILKEIGKNPHLLNLFHSWKTKYQKEFLDFCSGAKGIKILYDSYFKEVMNPEYDSTRLESFISTILGRNVKILQILPNDSTRLTDETTLLWTDVIVELEDGSIANVEVQKIGYAFSGQRSACYSSDMLLRQYKRVRGKRGDTFSYRDIKNVYLIVIYEKSPKEFHQLPEIFYHHARQVFDSGLKLNLLQEYIMIPLDIFHEKMQNKTIETELEAWLTFLSSDEPEVIIQLITQYPKFKAMYETLYQMCRNVEGVMHMFSKELQMLDRNTTIYMVDELQKELEQKDEQLSRQNLQLSQKDEQLSRQNLQLSQKDEQIVFLQKQLEQLQKNKK
ncbi:MAG: PD-(D/E)XK nuclease family transposase [Lachnospiraceae bacterium]|nr:PD-(D/E)XK nuclease family transposase [Lachnospiraceae bacterium]